MSDKLYKDIVKKLRDKQTRSVLISTHNSPDGDAIGSSVALELALKAMGKRVHLTFQDKVNKRFVPIVGENRVEKVLLPPDGYLYDVGFLLDCSNPTRTYEDHRSSARFHIIMDHHVPEKFFGDIYVHEYAPAAAVMVYKLIKLLGVKITREIANALYCAFRSDTGSYSFSNTDAEIHRFTAELLDAGADTQLITDMFSGTSIGQLKLLSEVVRNTLCYHNKLGISYAYVTQDAIVRNNATYEDAGGLIEYVRDVEDAEVGLLFIESYDGIRIRARSKHIPINVVMQHFGGNGHMKAAGARIEHKSIEKAVEEVVQYTTRYLEDLKINQH